MRKKITEAEYLDNADQYIGYCTACKEFTRECTEPDAEGYDCPECKNDTVMGTEQALLCGHIDFY